jgi:hypothetical protein
MNTNWPATVFLPSDEVSSSSSMWQNQQHVAAAAAAGMILTDYVPA